jgi:hypothetical protein
MSTETDLAYVMIDDQGNKLSFEKIFESIQYDHEKAKLVVSSVLAVSPNFYFLQKFVSQENMIKFVNMMDAENFAAWFDWRGHDLNDESLGLISREKLRKWASAKTYLELVEEKDRLKIFF